jgi:hypothetical protein
MGDPVMSGAGPARPSPAGQLRTALVVVLLAALYAGWSAWDVGRQRTLPLDLDGWGWLVPQLKADGRLATLFSSPSLWKGPVVPFVFGLSYYLVPSDLAVLAFNVAAFAVAAGCFYLGFCSFGLSRPAALLALTPWVLYWPHRLIFGYYYAEPFLTLLLAVLFLLTRVTLSARRPAVAALVGALSGVLLLARAPFFFGVCGLLLFLWYHGGAGPRRRRLVACWVAGFSLTFFPWALRNFLTYRELIPFTTEGGKILFQGTYLHGDGVGMSELRRVPEFAGLEKREGEDPIQQYRYWRALALAEVRQSLLGQARQCARKAIRFWVYLPEHTWVPAWKTTAVAALCLPLALAGALFGRRRPVVQLCTLWVGGLWAFHALIHAEMRYNFPVLPLLGALAVIGAGELARRFRLAPGALRELVSAPSDGAAVQ